MVTSTSGSPRKGMTSLSHREETASPHISPQDRGISSVQELFDVLGSTQRHLSPQGGDGQEITPEDSSPIAGVGEGIGSVVSPVLGAPSPTNDLEFPPSNKVEKSLSPSSHREPTPFDLDGFVEHNGSTALLVRQEESRRRFSETPAPQQEEHLQEVPPLDQDELIASLGLFGSGRGIETPGPTRSKASKWTTTGTGVSHSRKCGAYVEQHESLNRDKDKLHMQSCASRLVNTLTGQKIGDENSLVDVVKKEAKSLFQSIISQEYDDFAVKLLDIKSSSLQNFSFCVAEKVEREICCFKELEKKERVIQDLDKAILSVFQTTREEFFRIEKACDEINNYFESWCQVVFCGPDAKLDHLDPAVCYQTCVKEEFANAQFRRSISQKVGSPIDWDQGAAKIKGAMLGVIEGIRSKKNLDSLLQEWIKDSE